MLVRFMRRCRQAARGRLDASGSEPARYFAVTNCCFMMNLFHNVDYIFNSDYTFWDRFDPRTEGYFSGQGELTGRFFLTTNFVPDTHTLKLTAYNERGNEVTITVPLSRRF